MRLSLCAICLLLWCGVTYVLSQDFIGCGGFIRSDVEIDFTLIRVRLYTKQGSIKDEAECAPNNGYYMIPVYEKGEYVLQVEPPSGWGLTPQRVPLRIDGSTDPCSKGEDIDFRFTGFGLVGRVVSDSSEAGPVGVQVNLKDATGELRQSTVTTDGGRYIFANVLPGRYFVEATHPFWRFEKASTEVEVNKVTGDAGSSIVVHGYDVTGRIESEGEPVQGVTFLLFSDTDGSPNVYGCGEVADAEAGSGKTKKALCQVMSDDRGVFSFRSVPVGKYYVVPIYKGQLTSYEVRPSKETFTVGHESFSFTQPFLVTGFTVKGVVRSAVKGAAVAGAKVFVDGAHVATADANGSFELVGVKSGTYSVSASAEHMHFGESRQKVTPSSPVFPDVVPDRFDICGQIVLTGEGTGSSLRSLRSYPEDDPSRVTIVSANKDGTFCISATVGVRLVIEPIVSDAEKRAGLKLAPERRVETVTDRPILGLMFSQFLATVQGSVSCLESCTPTTVVLQSMEKTEVIRSTKLLVDDGKGSFTFENITPGRYKANLLLDAWCWDPAHTEINVEKKVETISFAHTGYKLSINASHDVSVAYSGEGLLTNVTANLNLHRGLNHFCLPAKGAYVITLPEAFCHRFEKDLYSCDTKDSPNFITMKAILHRVDGEVTLDDHAADVLVTVEIQDSESEVIGPLQVIKEGDTFVARFSFFAREGKRVRVSASAAEMLLSPSSAEATVAAERCPAALVVLSGHKGVFFRGKVTPAVVGVTVSIVAADGSVAAKALTDADGAYSIGPIAKTTAGYTVQAERAGYVLTPAADAEHDFVARKLSEVAVEVVDGAEQPLGGVLLSLTGGSAYKNNNLTHETGRFSFVGLAPGRYFLRPLMKEYQFQPPSQFVDVSEGQLVPVRLVGARIAFSCYGKMTSVHGEPEPSATVEAVGLDDCSKYAEEARTESDGTFRIRGLKPTCRYRLVLKNGSSPDSWIDRIVPEGQIIEVKDADVNAGLLLAIHPRVHTDVCLFVRTKEEHLSSVRLKLYRADGRDETLLQVVTPSQSSVVFFNLLQKNGLRHVVRLESTLPPSIYQYDAPEVSFLADAASKHLSIEFFPRPRPIQQDVSTGGSLAALAIVVASFVGFYNYQQVIAIAQGTLERLTGNRSAATYRSAGQSRSAGRQTGGAAATASATTAATAPASAAGELSDDLDWLTDKKEKKSKPRRT